MVTNYRLKQWSSLVFHDPVKVLQSLSNINACPIFGSGAWDFETTIQRNAKLSLENIDAVMFAYLIGKVLDIETNVAFQELSDYDSVLEFILPTTVSYNPLQLKQIVPESINMQFDMKKFINSLSKYTDSKDLLIGVKVGRSGLDENYYNVGHLGFDGVWFYGQCEDDKNKLWIRGDCQSDSIFHEFHWPAEAYC